MEYGRKERNSCRFFACGCFFCAHSFLFTLIIPDNERKSLRMMLDMFAAGTMCGYGWFDGEGSGEGAAHLVLQEALSVLDTRVTGCVYGAEYRFLEVPANGPHTAEEIREIMETFYRFYWPKEADYRRHVPIRP